MLVAAALLSFLPAATQSDPPVGLPVSYRREVVQTCAPQTIEAAEDCLRKSMNAEDLAILSDRIPARRFRGYIDCEIETAWRLGDSTSPMGGLMDRLLGIHNPNRAAGMIISDLQSRSSAGQGLPFDEMRKQLKKHPEFNQGSPTTCNPDTMPPADEKKDGN